MMTSASLYSAVLGNDADGFVEAAVAGGPRVAGHDGGGMSIKSSSVGVSRADEGSSGRRGLWPADGRGVSNLGGDVAGVRKVGAPRAEGGVARRMDDVQPWSVVGFGGRRTREIGVVEEQLVMEVANVEDVVDGGFPYKRRPGFGTRIDGEDVYVYMNVCV